MVPMFLTLLFGSMFAGGLLAWLGMRGRRINDHPICRWCGFDLEGVYPDGVTCPECGAGLKRDRAVRMGARKKSVVLSIVGLVLLLTPLVPIGAVALAALTGSDVNKYKPLGLLLWEARHAQGPQSSRIAAEIMTRALAKGLSPDQYTKVVEATLALQADTARPWSEAWGDLIERAKLDGVLTPAQEDRFVAAAAALELKTRDKVRAGSVVPVLIRLKEPRVASSSSVTTSLSFKTALIGGERAPHVLDQRAVPQQSLLGGLTGSISRGPDDLGEITVNGSRASGMMLMGSSDEKGLMLRVPEGLKPGVYDLEVDLESDASANSGMRSLFVVNGTVKRGGGSSKSASATTKLSARVEVVPPDADLVQKTAPDADMTSRLTTLLRPSEVTVGVDPFVGMGGSDPTQASVGFGSSPLPVGIAYDVFLRDGTNEHRLGTLTTGKTGPKPDQGNATFFKSSFTISINGKTTVSSNFSSDDARAVNGPMPAEITSDRVDVILRPSPAVAEGTLDLAKYYDQEIVFKDVPVVRDPIGSLQRDPFQLMPRLFQQPGGQLQPVPARPRRKPG